MNADEALREMREYYESPGNCLPIPRWADAIEAELKALREKVGKVAEEMERRAKANEKFGWKPSGDQMFMADVAARLREAVK